MSDEQVTPQRLMDEGIPSHVVDLAVAKGLNLRAVLDFFKKYGPLIVQILEGVLPKSDENPTTF